MALRDQFWEYPTIVIAIVKRFSLFFTILAGIVIGFIAVLILGAVITDRQNHIIFNGTLRYGIVGKLEFINPLEVGPTDAEQMATKLIYNSLVSIDEQGRLYPELAETWATSPDGREFTFFLKKGIKWHDGYDFTSKDVAATFALLQSGDADTVVGAIAKDVTVQVMGTYAIKFTLKQVNSAFLELTSTPILPEHLYTGMSYSRMVELGDSIATVGTGPYRYIKRVGDSLILQENANYYKGKPAIKEIEIKVYQSYELAEAAFLTGEVQVFAPIELEKISRLEKMESSSRRFMVQPMVQANNIRLLIFNIKKTNGIGQNVEVRQAIAKAIDKQSLIKSMPGATVAYGPYDKSSFAYTSLVDSVLPYSRSEANSLLEHQGWVYPYSGASYRVKQDKDLAFTLTFYDSKINKKVAEDIQAQLATVGVKVTLAGITSDTLTQSVLPQKEFEVLLLEIHTGTDPDQYGLWHSSQTTFPGLNLGGYNSPQVDTLLEKGRLQTNRDKRLEVYQQFQVALVKDAEAVFLYHPAYYEAYFDIIDRKIPITVVDPSDRFSSIQTWKLLPGWRNWQTR